MAYVRLVGTGDTGNGTTNWVNCVRDIVTGTIDSQADLEGASYGTSINLSSSVYLGTKPTAGIWSADSISSGGTSSSSWYASCRFKKYSYAKDQVSGYDPFCYIWMDVSHLSTSNSGGFRFRQADAAGTVKLPASTRNGYWGVATDVTNWRVSNSSGSVIANMHIIINDTTFFVYIEYNGTDSNSEIAFFGVTDHEFNSTLDTYLHVTEANWYPGSCWWGLWLNTMNADAGDAAGTSDNMHQFGLSKMHYLDNSGGSWREGLKSDEGTLHWSGPVANATTYYAVHNPLPFLNFFPGKGTNGDVHRLTPLQYCGAYNENIAYKQGDGDTSRIMNVYRTSNNLTNGARLQIGNDYYRVFRTHNCGTNDIDTASQKGCYAFPEHNIAY